MHTVEVSQIAKSFGETHAVVDVSFDVEKGEIFGLLGPNGAGKTTTIRMMLDIFKPDHGSISILGGKMDDTKKERIGYMPEERGLYQEIPLEQCLVYMGRLKGLTSGDVHARLPGLLERFDLAAHKKKKLKELSKGMQQKAQIIATIMHNPELLIIDEPFTALDPVNTQLVKDLMRELQAGGTTVIMCTHQMNQVEELCDRILLIDLGRVVLYGELAEIQKSFTGNAVKVRTGSALQALPGVTEVKKVNGSEYTLALADGTTPNQILKTLLDGNIELDSFEIAVPTLDEIFIQVVGKKNQAVL